jgi:hypothetical protein
VLALLRMDSSHFFHFLYLLDSRLEKERVEREKADEKKMQKKLEALQQSLNNNLTKELQKSMKEMEKVC